MAIFPASLALAVSGWPILKLGFIPIQNPNFVFGVLGHPVNFNFLSVLLLVVDAAMQGIF